MDWGGLIYWECWGVLGRSGPVVSSVRLLRQRVRLTLILKAKQKD